MNSQNAEQQISDIEICKKMEDEHCRLQRQVRVIQTDRQHRSMGVHPQFRRQDHLLRTLKKEYLNLYKDLKIARSGAHKKNDKRMKVDLKRALLLRTRTEQECEEGYTLMGQVEDLLYRKNKQMLELKKIFTEKSGQLEERRCLSENRLLWTENKLETARWRFDCVQSENRKIREEIEHMLNDRALFNQAWTKMLGVLNKGKKFLTDLFESSTLAYDQRDEWCTKLKSMQEKGKMDQMVQVQEMRDLQKAFDHEMKLYYFLAKKGLMRVNKKEEERQEAQKRKEQEEKEKEFQYHEEIVNEITDYTKEYNIDKIIETFEGIELANFSMYRLMTDYCAENEMLRRSLNKTRVEIEDRRDWNEKKEELRQQKLQILRDTLEQQRAITEEKRTLLAERTQLLNETMEKIDEIFKMLDCTLEPFQNLLGDKQPSLHHLDLTFSLMTEKIKDLVEITHYYERYVQKKGDKSTSRLKKYTVHPELPGCYEAPPINLLVPADPCPSCVEARWLSRVTDTPEVPFDRDMTLAAMKELAEDPAFERSDRIHLLTDCRVPRSRVILARRYMT